MLLSRGQAQDNDRAMSLLDEALATAHKLGMKSLVEKAAALNQLTISKGEDQNASLSNRAKFC
jgi:hypothetical protein